VKCFILHVVRKTSQRYQELQRTLFAAFRRSFAAIYTGGCHYGRSTFATESSFHGISCANHAISSAGAIQPDTTELASPQVYSTINFTQMVSEEFSWKGIFTLEQAGQVNALRFITKNILSISTADNSIIDWHNPYMLLRFRTYSRKSRCFAACQL